MFFIAWLRNMFSDLGTFVAWSSPNISRVVSLVNSVKVALLWFLHEVLTGMLAQSYLHLSWCLQPPSLPQHWVLDHVAAEHLTWHESGLRAFLNMRTLIIFWRVWETECEISPIKFILFMLACIVLPLQKLNSAELWHTLLLDMPFTCNLPGWGVVPGYPRFSFKTHSI